MLPLGDPVFMSHSSEVDMPTFERLAREDSWIDFPHDFIGANPLAPAFMTPAAFARLIPAYLVVSLTRYAESGALTSTVLTCLTPPDPADASAFEAQVEGLRARAPDVLLEEPGPSSLDVGDPLVTLFLERVGALNPHEKAAIRDYLAYIDAAHGEDFPVFGPRQALERYWAGAAGLTGASS